MENRPVKGDVPVKTSILKVMFGLNPAFFRWCSGHVLLWTEVCNVGHDVAYAKGQVSRQTEIAPRQCEDFGEKYIHQPLGGYTVSNGWCIFLPVWLVMVSNVINVYHSKGYTVSNG